MNDSELKQLFKNIDIVKKYVVVLEHEEKLVVLSANEHHKDLRYDIRYDDLKSWKEEHIKNKIDIIKEHFKAYNAKHSKRIEGKRVIGG